MLVEPVGHIVSNLVGYDRLVTDVQTVLETLESQERRVQTSGGLWFQMRIKPYRTVENVIEGVVITFVDVTQMKRVEDNWRRPIGNCDWQWWSRCVRCNHRSRSGGSHPRLESQCYQDLWLERRRTLALNVRQRVPVPLQRECMAQIARLCRQRSTTFFNAKID